VMLSQATRNIRRVRVLRVVDAASRRAQLQAKVGVGMSSKEFVKAMSENRVGHAGLSASLRLLAKGLGIALDRASETLRPLIAETPTHSSVLGPVGAGAVRGIYQVARGYRGDAELITLELIIALDEPHARDVVDIVGEPPLRFQGELPGDSCTVATLLSAAPLVVAMTPGVRTVLDIPLEQPEEPAEPMERFPRTITETELPVPVDGAAKAAKKRGAKKERPAAAAKPARGKKAAAPKVEPAPPPPAPKAPEPKAKKKAAAAKKPPKRSGKRANGDRGRRTESRATE
jgi:hypothetical protein